MKKVAFYLWSSLILILIVWVIFASNFGGWDAMKIPVASLALLIIVPVSIMLLQDRLATKKRMGKYWKNTKVTNAVFGEIEYQKTKWRTTEKFTLSLFGRAYSADVIALTSRWTIEEVNELQESSFQAFKDLIVRKRPEIEQAITDHLNKVSAISDFNNRYRQGYDLADIPGRFVPSRIEITRKGFVAIYVCDDAEEYGENDDWDEGFVITILPEIEVFSKELFQGMVSGGIV